MATTIRQLTLRAKAEGIRETSAEVRQLGAATDELAKKVARETAVRERADRLLAARERVLRAEAKAAYDLARATDVHTKALEQNLITEERYRQNLALERQRAFMPVQRIADRAAANDNARMSSGWERLGAMGAANMANIEASRRIAGMGAAGKEAAKGVALARHQMTNLGYQITDVATMLAMGQSPFMILASQGGHFLDIFAGAQGGVTGVLKQVGATLLSWMTPVTLIIAALLGVGAAIAAFSFAGRRSIESLEDSFARHTDTIRRVKELYGDAASGLRDMASEGEGVVRTLSRIDEMRLRAQLFEQSAGTLRALGSGGQPEAGFDAMGAPTGMTETSGFTVSSRFAAFRPEIEALQKSFEDGTPRVLAFRAAVSAKIEGGLFGPEALATGEELLKITQKLDENARSLEAAIKAAGQSFDTMSVGSPAFSRQMDEWLKTYRADKAERQAQQSYGFDLRDIAATTTAQRAAVAADRARADALRDTATAAYADAIAQRAAGLVYAEAAKRMADADREHALAMRERFDAARADIAMTGQSVAAIEQERFKRERLAEIERDALQNGEAWARKQRAAVDDLATAWGALAGRAAEAKMAEDLAFRASQIGRDRDDKEAMAALRSAGLLRNGAPVDDNARRLGEMTKLIALQERQVELTRDLQFERDQIFRSDLEGKIAERLRSLNIEAESAYGRQVAEIMRVNDALMTVKDTLREPFTSFLTDLSEGKGFKEAAASAAKMLGSRMAEQGANSLYDSIWGAMGSIPGMKELGLGTKLNGPGDIVRSPLPRLLAPTDDRTAAANAAPFSAVTASTVGGGMGFVGNYRRGVDPRLTEILNEAAQRSGYKVEAFSGFRPGDPRFHGKGMATDVRLLDPATGKALPNYQNAESFRAYEEFAQTARTVQMERYPGLADDFRWGGYFGGARGKYGAMDTMHFDLGGRRTGMGGGSWEGGLTPAQRALWPGAQSQGMASSPMPDLKVANDNLLDFSKTAADSTKNLGGFGQGLGQLGQAMGNGVPSLGASAGGGDPLSGLLMGGFSLISKLFGFDKGGYTGAGGVDDPAGVVHRGEVVWSQADVARAGGVAVVEAMRLGMIGYAEGGEVGGFGGGGPTMPHAAADAAAPRRAPSDRGPISVTGGDVIIQGDANARTIAQMRKEMRDNSERMLEEIWYRQNNGWREDAA